MKHRLWNFLIALALALFLFPIIVAIGAIILLTRSGPVFYSEKRVGFDGKAFTLYKFRTLESAGDRWIPPDDLAGRVLKNGTPGGCRGRFFRALRKYSLDELPQIWNVLRGDMAVVGPRPMPEWELLYRFGADFRTVTSVRPGLTGLWQINGRSDLSPEKRRTMDLLYVERRSRRLDLIIIFKTFSAVLSGRGAY
jgi:lipopolysaccharide/colanic/teichoic acid biosynthesis glycosyltransferase